MRFLAVLAVVMSACLPSQLHAEGLPLLPPLSGLPSAADATEKLEAALSFLPSPGVPGLKLGKVALNPYVQAGYTQVGCNISFPIQVREIIPVDNQLEIGTMELLLQDASFWTGVAGLNAVLNPSVALFASAGGFAPRPIGAPAILPIRINGVTLPSQVDFTGLQVQYWYMQAGASFSLWCGWSFLAGYFWDQFGMVADDPRIGSMPLSNQTIRADSLTKTWVPFVGLQFNEPKLNYRFSVLYSPLARCQIIVAIRNSQSGVSQLQYTFNKPGQYAVFSGEYDWSLNKTTYLSLWATGLWLRATGSGDMTFESPSRGIFAGKEESDASISKYSIAGGLGLGVAF